MSVLARGRSVHVVVPDGIDDPARPSGGNAYDRRICSELVAIGWAVHESPVTGSWPVPDETACATLADSIGDLPDGAVVLLDGLVASSVPQVLVPEATRLRLVVLVHMPLGAGLPSSELPADTPARERAVLSSAAAVVTTSNWTRQWLIQRYTLQADRVHVAEPGVDTADLASGSAAGGELLCVAAVTPHKGHNVLLAALAMLTDLTWRCVCVGSVTREPAFVDRLRAQAAWSGMADRVLLAGPRSGDDLAAAYAAADLLVLASRAETYGMVVTEALARGIPIVASAAGGLPEALGCGSGGNRPGLLVPPGDVDAFATALRWWLEDVELRRRLRQTAQERRRTLAGWPATGERVARILAEAGR